MRNHLPNRSSHTRHDSRIPPRKTEDEVTSGVKSTELITQGMYSIVRHPIALGNLLAWYGIILYVGVSWFIIGAILLYTLFTYQILLCEEEELAKRFGDRYSLWASYTNALIPNRKLWIRSRDKFSLMQVLRREYIGFFSWSSHSSPSTCYAIV